MDSFPFYFQLTFQGKATCGFRFIPVVLLVSFAFPEAKLLFGESFSSPPHAMRASGPPTSSISFSKSSWHWYRLLVGMDPLLAPRVTFPFLYNAVTAFIVSFLKAKYVRQCRFALAKLVLLRCMFVCREEDRI